MRKHFLHMFCSSRHEVGNFLSCTVLPVKSSSCADYLRGSEIRGLFLLAKFCPHEEARVVTSHHRSYWLLDNVITSLVWSNVYTPFLLGRVHTMRFVLNMIIKQGKQLLFAPSSRKRFRRFQCLYRAYLDDRKRFSAFWFLKIDGRDHRRPGK